MNVSSDNNMQEGDNKNFGVLNKRSLFDHAPLAAPEDDSDDLAEYAQVKDVYGLDGVVGSAPDPNLFNFPHDTSTSKSSKLRHRREKGQSKLISANLILWRSILCHEEWMLFFHFFNQILGVL